MRGGEKGPVPLRAIPRCWLPTSHTLRLRRPPAVLHGAHLRRPQASPFAYHGARFRQSPRATIWPEHRVQTRSPLTAMGFYILSLSTLSIPISPSHRAASRVFSAHFGVRTAPTAGATVFLHAGRLNRNACGGGGGGGGGGVGGGGGGCGGGAYGGGGRVSPSCTRRSICQSPSSFRSTFHPLLQLRSPPGSNHTEIS